MDSIGLATDRQMDKPPISKVSWSFIGTVHEKAGRSALTLLAARGKRRTTPKKKNGAWSPSDTVKLAGLQDSLLRRQ
jgi:hypothetical protein